jgi:hypothetical protein
VSTPDEMKKAIRSEPNAVGYLPANEVPAGVKVVTIIKAGSKLK